MIFNKNTQYISRSVKFTTSLIFHKERYKEYWKYVVERQRIWYKRFVLKRPYPWTNDRILKKYRFCNNYRELDKGTIYLIEKIKFIKNDRRKVLSNVVAYKFFNIYGFFEKIGGLLDPTNYNPYIFIKILNKLITKREDIYNPAYVVCPPKVRSD